MNILYAIQGTGNGHITRSLSIIREFKKKANVDILVSGIHSELKLPLEVKYSFRGLGFVFGKNGGINYYQTFKQNSLKTLFSEMKQLKMDNYDCVVSDFEPLSVWAASQLYIPTIGLSNQVTVANPLVEKPQAPVSFGRLILENYARCDYNIGLHFEAIGDFIETPVIRDEIRNGVSSDQGHGLVYLPFYSDEILHKVLQKHPLVKWTVFSKHSKSAYKIGNIHFEPVNGKLFTEKLLSCHLVVTAAGFGTTSEALYLGKKLVVVPMKGQYEQIFNAYTLKKYGVQVLNSILLPETTAVIENILNSPQRDKMNYPDNVKRITDKVMQLFYGQIKRSYNAVPQQISECCFDNHKLNPNPFGAISY